MLEQHGACPILKLPYRLRTTIYRYAGVPTKTEVHLDTYSDQFKKRKRSKYPSCELSWSRSLLLTCQLFYEEVTGLLYGTNRFLLKPSALSDLRLLATLRPGTLKLLRSLTVHLNYRGDLPEPSSEAPFYIDPSHLMPTSRPIALCQGDEDLLEEWQLAISWVLKHVEPSKLCLRVVCDCEDLKTAQYVTRPISDSGAVLSDCALRLGLKPTEELSREAQTTACRATCQFERKGHFMFMKLPLELRRYVLELTNLVTPRREIEWAPRRGYHTIMKWTDVSDGRELEPCCGNLGYPYSLGPCSPTRHETGCFCRRYHSAYSRICQCWLQPSPMFRVSRSFRNEAASVFFSQNRFVVRSKRGFDSAAKYTPGRIAPTIFFFTLGDDLKHLRYLELVFPPVDYDYLQTRDSAYARWLESISFAGERLDLPNLTLLVVMADHAKSGRNVTHFRYNISAEQADTIIKMYFRIIQPLHRLKEKGLRKFFVSLTWPSRWTERGQNLSKQERASVAQEMAELEKKVEQAVMGEGHDSDALRKTTPTSLWTNRFGSELNMFTHAVDNSESENDLDE